MRTVSQMFETGSVFWRATSSKNVSWMRNDLEKKGRFGNLVDFYAQLLHRES